MTEKLTYTKHDGLPFISAFCITYGRVDRLQEAIEFFLRQDYAGKKEMVIFNDCQAQKLVFDHPEVKVINSPVRLGSMGECRNECIKHCTGDVLVIFDDDDVFFPGYLTMMAKAINGHGTARFNRLFDVWSFQIKSISAYVGGWSAFRREAFDAIGGYSKMNAGDDQDINTRLEAITTVGVADLTDEEIQFGYSWSNGCWHVSGRGFDKPGETNGNQAIEEYTNQQVKDGKIPTGQIVLRPGWEHDWLGQRERFLTYKKTAAVPPKLSILIAVLNDNTELNETIRSIRETAGPAPEIIVIDDFSNPPVVLDNPFPRTILHRNQQRYGCGASRHIAAIHAQGQYLLVIDAHMRFESGWYEEAMRRIEAAPETVFCGTCMGLGEGAMEMIFQPETRKASQIKRGQVGSWKNQWVFKEGEAVDGMVPFKQLHGDVKFLIPGMEKIGLPAVASYTGATINFYGRDQNDPKQTQIFEGVWKDHPNDNQEIPCLMGASYFIARDLFFKLGGLKQLRQWGSDEPMLSLVTWLAGYEVRLMRNVRIGHKFRTAIPGTNPPQYESPYRTDLWSGLYNKIRCLMTILNQEESTFLISKLAETSDKPIFNRAVSEIRRDMVEIMEAERVFKAMFKHDLRWFCTKFGVNYPLEQTEPLATK